MAHDKRRPLLSKRVLRREKHGGAPERHGRHCGRDNRVRSYRVGGDSQPGMWKSVSSSYANPFAVSGARGSVRCPGPGPDGHTDPRGHDAHANRDAGR